LVQSFGPFYSGADTDNYAQSSVYQQCAAPGHAMRILV